LLRGAAAAAGGGVALPVTWAGAPRRAKNFCDALLYGTLGINQLVDLAGVARF
jgi:hypothetical protein